MDKIRDLFKINEATTALINAEFILDCPDMTLEIIQLKNSPVYKGSGYIKQSSNGSLEFKLFSKEEFDQKAVYWAAVDKFVKAKSVDPQLTDEANRYIEAYKARFPDGETIFFYNYKQGDSYTVECWINEKTTVRAR